MAKLHSAGLRQQTQGRLGARIESTSGWHHFSSATARAILDLSSRAAAMACTDRCIGRMIYRLICVSQGSGVLYAPTAKGSA